jgi:hypothetical protein
VVGDVADEDVEDADADSLLRDRSVNLFQQLEGENNENGRMT